MPRHQFCPSFLGHHVRPDANSHIDRRRVGLRSKILRVDLSCVPHARVNPEPVALHVARPIGNLNDLCGQKIRLRLACACLLLLKLTIFPQPDAHRGVAGHPRSRENAIEALPVGNPVANGFANLRRSNRRVSWASLRCWNGEHKPRPLARPILLRFRPLDGRPLLFLQFPAPLGSHDVDVQAWSHEQSR
jgi:hypothetical protein